MRRLKSLLERRTQAELRGQALADELALEVYRVRRDEGVSARKLATELGVGASTVHGWTRRGRQLAGE